MEEGCIHIWYSESVMLQVSDSIKNISCVSIIVSTWLWIEPWRTVETVVRKKWMTHLPSFSLSMMALKDYVRNFFKTVWLGFVQSCEFLKKSWNLPNYFPDLEKVWKMVKSLEFFFLQLYKWNLFCFGQILFNLALTFCVKKTLFLHFLRSVFITYLITQSLEK